MTEEVLTPHTLGKRGEEVALDYLRKKKYRIISRGFRLFRGEIDIIAYDGTVLVFVEVKTRARTTFGLPEDSVTPAKQNQIRKIAQGFLVRERLGDANCRFDVLAVMITGDNRWAITHYKDAF